MIGGWEEEADGSSHSHPSSSLSGKEREEEGGTHSGSSLISFCGPRENVEDEETLREGKEKRGKRKSQAKDRFRHLYMHKTSSGETRRSFNLLDFQSRGKKTSAAADTRK